MHDCAITRQEFGGAYPPVFFEAGVDLKVLVANRSFRLHLKGPVAHGDDSVRFPGKLPAVCELQRLWNFRTVTFRTPGRDPVAHVAFFLGRHDAGIPKVAMLRIRVPGRHALIFNHLQHGVAPADDLFVAGE